MIEALLWTRLGLAGALAALSVLAVVQTPLGALWKPRVAATEWGHVLAPLSLLCVLGGWSDTRGAIATGLALVAAGLFLTPLARAIPTASAVAGQVRDAFGPVGPSERPGAAARSDPLVLSDLWSIEGATAPVSHRRYRDDPALELDVYGVPEASPRPAVIAFHGGSWNSGDSTQLAAIYHYLARRGYAVVAANYRLAPAHTFPAQRDDVLAVIAHVKDHADALGIDPERLALYGRSAGGQLALLGGYVADDPAIRGVIALYAPNDMNWSWEHPTNPLVLDTPGTLGEYLGGPRDQVPDQYDDASAMDFVSPATPPTLLIHGVKDELVFHRQSERLATKLTDAGVANCLVSLPWATHGCEANLAGPGGQITVYAVERFLAHVLR